MSPSTPLAARAAENIAPGTPADPIVAQWSKFPTVGVEWEVGVVDPQTMALVDGGAVRLRAACSDPRFAPQIYDELFGNTIEMISRPASTVAEMVVDLRRTAEYVAQTAHAMGMALCPLGTHPTSEPWLQSITPNNPRRDHRIDFHGDALRRQQIFSVHLHTGVPTADNAVRASSHLAEHVPYFIALSAASPYFAGRDMGLAASRLSVCEPAPFTGQTPLFDSWDEYASCFEHLMNEGYGFVRHPKDLHWEVRISRHGTVEIRVCDSVATTAEIGALAALAQCLVVEGQSLGRPARARYLRELDLEGNRFQAIRYGLDAPLHDVDGAATIRQRLPDTVARLQPIAEQLGCAGELSELTLMAGGSTPAERQREAVRLADGDLGAAARHQTGEMYVNRRQQPGSIAGLTVDL